MRKLIAILVMATSLPFIPLGGGQTQAALLNGCTGVKIDIDAEKLTHKDPEGCTGDLLTLHVAGPTGVDFTGLTGAGSFLNACAQPQDPITLIITGSSISGDTITLSGGAELNGVSIALLEIRIDLTGPGGAVVVTVDFPPTPPITSSFNSLNDDLTVDISDGACMFADFTLTKVKVEFENDPGNDSFEVKGEVILDPSSAGINPVNEDVVVTVGTATITIPAGSFVEEDPGKFKYEGVINGTDVEMKIKVLAADAFKFEMEAEGVDLTDTANPLDLSLIIGDDNGTVNVRLEGKLKLGDS